MNAVQVGPLRATRFDHFPTEWKLEIGEGDWEDALPRLGQMVRVQGGQWLIHISRDSDGPIRDRLKVNGFEDYFQNYWSELDLNQQLVEMKVDGYQVSSLQLAKEWHATDRDIRQILEGQIGDKLFFQLYQLECRTSDDIPGRTGFSHPSFSEYRRRFMEDADLGTMVLAWHGSEVVGLSYCYTDTDRAGIFYTGVDQSHRGQGLGTALKSTLAWLLQDQGYHILETSNRSTNLPVLRTNQKLRFKIMATEYLLRLRL